MSRGSPLAWPVATALVFLAVVSGGCDDERCCTSDAECARGAACFEGLCTPRCSHESQCRVGERCLAAGVCAAPERPPSPCGFSFKTGGPVAADAGPSADAGSPPPDAGVSDGGAGPCVDDAHEPNDDPQAAPLFAAGVPVAATLCPGDLDFFAFDLPAATRADVELFYAPTTSLELVVSYDETGAVLISDEGDGAEHVAIETEAGGRALVEVRGAATEPGAFYELVVRVSGACDDPFEPNDTLDEATGVSAPTVIDGVICGQDVDLFRIADWAEASELQLALLGAPDLFAVAFLESSGEALAFVGGEETATLSLEGIAPGDLLILVGGEVPGDAPYVLDLLPL